MITPNPFCTCDPCQCPPPCTCGLLLVKQSSTTAWHEDRQRYVHTTTEVYAPEPSTESDA